MEPAILVGIVSGLAAILGAAIGAGTSVLVHRSERRRHEEAFRRQALDRFRRDRLEAYSALARTAIKTWVVDPEAKYQAIEQFVEMFWSQIYLLEHEDYLRLREQLRKLTLAGFEHPEALEPLLVDLRAFTARSAAYQAIWYENELRAEPHLGRAEIEQELTRKGSALARVGSPLWQEFEPPAPGDGGAGAASEDRS